MVGMRLLIPGLLILALVETVLVFVLLLALAAREPCRHYLTDDGNGTPARLVLDCAPRE